MGSIALQSSVPNEFAQRSRFERSMLFLAAARLASFKENGLCGAGRAAAGPVLPAASPMSRSAGLSSRDSSRVLPA